MLSYLSFGGVEWGCMTQLFFDNASTLLGVLGAVFNMTFFGVPIDIINEVCLLIRTNTAEADAIDVRWLSTEDMRKILYSIPPLKIEDCQLLIVYMRSCRFHLARFSLLLMCSWCFFVNPPRSNDACGVEELSCLCASFPSCHRRGSFIVGMTAPVDWGDSGSFGVSC